MTLFRRLAALAAFSIFVQIVLGAVVRLTDSGLSCPDWPLCYGLWFPTPDKLAALPSVDYTFGQVMAEWTHRLNAAAVVSPLILILLIVAVRLRRTAPGLLPTMVGAVLVLLVQAGLGGFTVLDRNSPWSVAVHLSVALVLLALVLRARMVDQVPTGGLPRWTSARIFPALTALLVLATVASGAMMAKSGASLACSTWPLCDGALIPDMSDPGIHLHFGHRLLALGTGFAVIATWLVARHADPGLAGRLRSAANMVLAIFVGQVLIGAVVVYAFGGGSLWPQVAAGAFHQAVGVLLFGTLVIMTVLAGRAPSDAGGIGNGTAA
jgi:heme A synthase